ncbi:MAG: hypothetical protein KME16_02335 [Scytolyngbya sp. HA4215-MV1]|nr:hypothetical protein [Scytolyngbya sp. HA4215-MV1]
MRQQQRLENLVKKTALFTNNATTFQNDFRSPFIEPLLYAPSTVATSCNLREPPSPVVASGVSKLPNPMAMWGF